MSKKTQSEKAVQLQPDQLKIDLFKGKHEIRKIFHQSEWWFSVLDVTGILSDTENPRRYWSDLKRKLKFEGATQLYENIVQLKLPASDGKMRTTDCANTESMLRIVQSIPSKNAEPFKRWLAKVGFERMQEIEQPGLAVKRARATYLAKGYDDEWIERRMQNIQKREELTEEWSNRGVEQGIEYAILTAEISDATFGHKPAEYKEIKGLSSRENLRDHMTPLELIFSTLGEVATKEITVHKDAQGFDDSLDAAKDGGKIAGDARRALEKQTGKAVVTSKNYKALLSSVVGKKEIDIPPINK
jgi:DNA-damage-inducible protein D